MGESYPIADLAAAVWESALWEIHDVLQKDICASDMLDEIEAIVKEAIHG